MAWGCCRFLVEMSYLVCSWRTVTWSFVVLSLWGLFSHPCNADISSMEIDIFVVYVLLCIFLVG